MVVRRIMVVLQNAYGVGADYQPSFENESFVNSQTGRRLKEMIPDSLVITIVNASPEIGDTADSYFPPVPAWVYEKYCECAPDVILACGKAAKDACKELNIPVPIIETYHPAYRALSKEITRNIYERLNNLK